MPDELHVIRTTLGTLFQNTTRHNISEHGTSKQHCVKIKPRHSPKWDVGFLQSRNCAAPRQSVRDSLLCRKIAALFADLHLLRDRENGADFVLRYNFCLKHHFCVLFLIKSAPCRLTPIEALPQTPQGTLSLDPASPLTPGLSLRFISRYARCWGTTLVSYAHSSFLTPHSSFERRFPLHIVSRGLLLPFLPLYFAVLCNFTIIFGCFNVKNPLSCSIPLQTLFSLSKQ